MKKPVLITVSVLIGGASLLYVSKRASIAFKRRRTRLYLESLNAIQAKMEARTAEAKIKADQLWAELGKSGAEACLNNLAGDEVGVADRAEFIERARKVFCYYVMHLLLLDVNNAYRWLTAHVFPEDYVAQSDKFYQNAARQVAQARQDMVEWGYNVQVLDDVVAAAR